MGKDNVPLPGFKIFPSKAGHLYFCTSMRRNLFLFFLWCIHSAVFAQWQDCSSALVPDSQRFFVPRPAEGFGKVRELQQSKIPDLSAFPMERNSTWIRFHIPEAGKLSFRICPQFASDDYDFMLLHGGAEGFCDSTKYLKSVRIIRSVISRNDSSVKACTGLSEKDSLLRVPIGRGPSFGARTDLIEGDFLLVVASNKKLQGGFFFEYQVEIPVKTLQDSLSRAFLHNIKATRNTLYLSASDSSSTASLSSSWMIQTLSGSTDTLMDSLKTLVMPWQEKMLVTSLAPGFLPMSKLFVHSPDSLSLTDTFRLKRILPDSIMVLSFVFFQGNTDQILPESSPAMHALLRFMNNNPGVKIEIQGHVNAPGQKNGRSLRKLSEARAYAIKKFLTFNGIKKNRVKTEGFGNEKMLFPDPQTPEQSEQNRRVEVKIISVELPES